MTQNNLASAYRTASAASGRTTWSGRSPHYEAALTVRTREAFPADWAMTAEQPGDRLREPHPRRAGGQPGAGDRALRAGAHRLDARGLPRRLGADPEQPGDRLPEPHPRRAGGEPGAGDRRTTKRRSRSTPARPSRGLGATQNNLASPIGNRIRGERADNLERAIAHYEAALTVYTREAFPIEWARTQNNLGAAFVDRTAASRRTTSSGRLRAYEAALTVRTREAFPTTGRRRRTISGSPMRAASAASGRTTSSAQLRPTRRH